MVANPRGGAGGGAQRRAGGPGGPGWGAAVRPVGEAREAREARDAVPAIRGPAGVRGAAACGRGFHLGGPVRPGRPGRRAAARAARTHKHCTPRTPHGRRCRRRRHRPGSGPDALTLCRGAARHPDDEAVDGLVSARGYRWFPMHAARRGAWRFASTRSAAARHGSASTRPCCWPRRLTDCNADRLAVGAGAGGAARHGPADGGQWRTAGGA